MRKTFEHEKSIPSDLSGWRADLYKPREDIDPQIWNKFLAPVSPVRVWDILSKLSNKTSPGWDLVDHAMLKTACRPSETVRAPFVLRRLTSLINRCICNSTFPSHGKIGITVMVPKPNKKSNKITDKRPITLLSLPTNLTIRIISERLSNLVCDHGLLHVNNRGFVKGGDTAQCIDAILDVIEQRMRDSDIHLVQLDIKKAYDSVQFHHIHGALRRLAAPARVIDLIMSLVQGSTRQIRTLYGLTTAVKVLCSLPQGMPASAVLFAICIDTLHSELAKRYQTQSLRCPSLGYADDVTLIHFLFLVLVRMVRYSETWCRAHNMALCGNKVNHYYKGVGNYEPLTVNGTQIEHKSGSDVIKCLGVHFTLEGIYKQT